MKNGISLAAVLLLLCSTTAFGQLSVNRSVIEFSPSEKIQDIEVMNNGKFKIYVNMGVAEIINPERDNSTRVELDDPRTAAVLVSPKQLLIPPGQRKRVRVILREPATSVDKVYRLSIKPYTGKLNMGGAESGKTASAIQILVGYDLLMLSRPSKLQPDLKVTRTSDTIKFTNRGNTNVLLRKIEQCDKNAVYCVDLKANRLYAGETYEVQLPKKGSAEQYPVNVWESVGLNNSKGLY